MYNPSLHTATNKPIGLLNKPVDARTYYYDTTTFSYRPYVNTDEVKSYLSSENRIGQFSVIVVNPDGGYNEWWFRNGYTDSDLILKGTAQWGDIGGDILSQDDLIDYINAQELKAIILIPTGSNIPVNYPLITPYNSDYEAVFYIKETSTRYQRANDIVLIDNFTDISLETISSIDIYGHTDDGTTTSDDLIVILYLKRNGMPTQTKIERIVNTYADMITLIATADPTLIYEYTVLVDEENGDVLGIYYYYNGNLSTNVQQDITL